MNIIINNYKKICNMLKENLLKIVIGCTFIFIISIIIGMLYGTYNFNKTVENVVEFVQENEDYEPDNELKNALGFIKNNTAICFEGIVIGTIPFAFVSIPLLIKNGYFIGMALVFCKEISGTSIMKLLVFEILPHGVFLLRRTAFGGQALVLTLLYADSTSAVTLFIPAIIITCLGP